MGRPLGSKNVKGTPQKKAYICEVCGKEFYAYPSYRKEERKFCSEACYRKSRKGYKPSNETIKKLSLSHLGKHPGLGRVTSIETRVKLSKALRGEKSYLWKGGISDVNNAIRKSVYYKVWRESVYKRDKYICQDCGARSGNGHKVILNAHHIVPFSKDKNLRLSVENGITLCQECHTKRHRKQEAV